MLTLALSLIAGAQACSASDFGPVSQDPLVIDGVWTVGNGCFLDFGARHVEIRGTLEVTTVRIRAAAITVADGGKILGDAHAFGTTTLETFVGGGWDGAVLILGRVEQNNDFSAGAVLVDSGGDVLIAGSGQVEARGLAADVDGGYVEIVARDLIEVNGAATSLDVSGGGRDAAGGSIYLESRRDRVDVMRILDAHGQQGGGGGLEMLAYAGSVTASGLLDLHATGYGDGGELTIAAHELIRLGGLVNADAGGGTLADGGGTGGTVTLECDREVEILDRIHAAGGIDSDGGTVEVDCRDFLFTGSRVDLQSTGYGGSGGSFTVAARRDATIAGTLDLDGDDLGFGGSVDVTADGALVFSGDVSAKGGDGGDVSASCASSASVSGAWDAGGKGSGGAGGDLMLDVAGELDLAGASLEADGYSASGRGGTVTVRAGPVLAADAATRLRARGNASNGGTPGVVTVEGCRVTFPSGSQISADGAQPGGSVTIRANDVLTLGGSVRADQGEVRLTTRLDAPWSPLLAGASVVPPPVVVHDPLLAPCLSADSTWWSGPATVRAGDSFSLTLRSVPNRKTVVALDLAPQPVPLGPLGWQALSPATARFAADFGRFGPPIPGSRTDAQGLWTWTSPPVPPAFLGRTLYAEGFVVDPGARNGAFHQTALWAVAVIP